MSVCRMGWGGDGRGDAVRPMGGVDTGVEGKILSTAACLRCRGYFFLPLCRAVLSRYGWACGPKTFWFCTAILSGCPFCPACWESSTPGDAKQGMWCGVRATAKRPLAEKAKVWVRSGVKARVPTFAQERALAWLLIFAIALISTHLVPCLASRAWTLKIEN